MPNCRARPTNQLLLMLVKAKQSVSGHCKAIRPEVLECPHAYAGKVIVRLQQLVGSVELLPPMGFDLDMGVQVSGSYWPSSS